MYKVIEKFKNCTVYNSEFTVNLWEASQEQLEHLFHLGHKGIEFVGKKPKNKPVDNFVTETTDNTNE